MLIARLGIGYPHPTINHRIHTLIVLRIELAPIGITILTMDNTGELFHALGKSSIQKQIESYRTPHSIDA
jgi:hypothetical protein